jgi:RNA polymerase sigma factor (sigma-70 family)
LFVAEQQTVRLETNQAYIEISRQQALSCVTGLERIEQQIDVKRVVDKLMANATPREKIVIDCRYTQEMTLDETAKHIGVSKERARQIEAKALRRARILSNKDRGLQEESKALIR